MRGIAGYGRYDDDPGHVACPRAKSDMTPCIARDGHLAVAGTDDKPGLMCCVGCEQAPATLLAELARKYRRAGQVTVTGSPRDVADVLAREVLQATEPLVAAITAQRG